MANNTLDEAEVMQRIKSYYEHKIKKTTDIVKRYPFIYTLLLLVLSPFEAWLSIPWAEALGLLTFTSVPSAWLCWKLSYPLKLCNWYRVQCFVMLLPLSIPLCRIFYPGLDVALVWVGVFIVLLVSLVSARIVLIKSEEDEENQEEE